MRSRPRIAVLSIHPLYDTRIAKHLRTLVNSRHAVSYINWNHVGVLPRIDQLDQVTVRNARRNPALQGNPLKYVGMLLWFLWMTLRERPKLAHIHDLVLLPLALPLRVFGIRVVFDVHEDYQHFDGRVGAHAARLYRIFLPHVAGLIGVSLKVLPEFGGPMFVVPNFQERTLYQDYQSERNLPNSVMSIVYFGSLSTTDRDVELMLDVARLCLSQNSDIEFKYGGPLKGPESSRLLAQIQDLATEYPTGFKWFGEVDRDTVVRHTATASIGFLFAKDCDNYKGSSPNKVYEYLTAGAGIFATDGFEIATQVTAVGAGRLYPPGVDAGIVVKDIEALLNDRVALQNMRDASTEMGKGFSWEEVEDRYLELYRRAGVE